MLIYVIAIMIGFFVTALMGPWFIPYLRRLKFGQSILEDGPVWHSAKSGTPTMGGIMFIAGTVVACVFLVRDARAYYALIMALFFGFIGFIDDYTKVVKKRNKGLSARQKLFLQILVSAAYLISLRIGGYIDTGLMIPFINTKIELSALYYPAAVFIIVGCVNAVNLTDGLDGLASSVTIPVCVFFTAVSFIFHAQGLGVLSCAVCGGLIGFLIYNAHPAKVFMGDTGSLFLGGAVCALAFAYNIPVILVFAGIVYVIEALSDIIQVISFKSTGRRVFKMAPIHHHFEMCGWSENRIVAVFTAVSAAFCLLAFLGVSRYYYM